MAAGFRRGDEEAMCLSVVCSQKSDECSESWMQWPPPAFQGPYVVDPYLADPVDGGWGALG